MKRLFYILIGLTLIFGCEEELELEPSVGIDINEVISNEDNISKLLIGSYSIIREENALGGMTQIISDLLGSTNQVSYQGFFNDPREFFIKDISVSNERVNNLWLNYYRVINNANLIINNANIIESTDNRIRILGEAKFLRALAYFELIRFFSLPYDSSSNNNIQPGVPLRLNGITDYSNVYPLERSSNEEIYAQIIIDLLDSIENLPEINGVFADKYSASALLARVYLQQGNYTDALTYSNAVIMQSDHSLVQTYNQAFNNDQDSSEDLFSIQMNEQEASKYFEGANDLIIYYASFDNGGLGGFIFLNNEFIEQFNDENDIRASFYYIDPTDGTRLTSKYVNRIANISIIRLAEMYLIRAESNYRLNSELGQSPIDDINKIRMRAGANALEEISLSLILKERQLELAFEGHLIHDLKRTKQNVGNLSFDDPKLLLPIPLDEININPLIDQNPGY